MDWAVLLSALITVESGGNPKAIGDHGQAIGPLQIHMAVIEDVNRIYSRNFRPSDRLRLDKSKAIASLYLLHYGTRYEIDTGERMTYEVAARIWNGGPRGYRKTSTIPYWYKVRDVLEN